MRRQRWRKRFKSFIDPGEDEQLRGIKKEIDGGVQKIYDYLKEQDGNDTKEALADLIANFRKHYDSLYARYDNLTGELRNKFRGKSGKNDASSSSDSSDSDVSPAEIRKRSGEVEIAFEEELERKFPAVVDEKEALHLEYQSALKGINSDVSFLREENKQLQIRNSEMEKALMDRENDISDLQKTFGDRESELSAEVNNLREQLGFLSDQKSEADRIVEKQLGEMSDTLVQIKNIKDELSRAEDRSSELETKIVEQEREMKEQNDEFLKLSEEHKQLGVCFRDCHESLVLSEKKIDEISNQFRDSMSAKTQDINQLEETIDELKSELDMKDDEISTLVENMRATEVKQRLVGQKLRITEQVLSEQEEIHQKRVEKLMEEQQLHEERIASLAGIVSMYKEAQVNLVSEISEKMNETLLGIDTFSMKFEEDYGHLESRIYEIGNDLKVVVSWMSEQLKDGKERELLLKGKIEAMETILQKNEEERKCLTQSVKELELMLEERNWKLGELQKRMNEKDVVISTLNEEKREVIRQLCISIDFHRNRYEDLICMILKRRGGTRQVAT